MQSFNLRALCASFTFAVAFSGAALAQVGPRAPLETKLLADAASIDAVEFDALDVARLDAEDAINDAVGGPMRFAIERAVSLNPTNVGEWSSDGADRSVWKLRIVAHAAPHLYLRFKQFDLPAGAKLFVTDPSGAHVLGPYTEADELPHGQLATQLVPGDTALVLLDVPNGKQDDLKLELASVYQGYRGFGTEGITCKSGACNMDVACLGTGDA